jgi:predicted acyl esterase
MIRARYRRGFEAEVMLIPGQIEQFVVEMRPIGIRFLKGSRLRLDVTSSDFPYMDRNHNTGRPFHTDKELQIARQTIYHDAARPSCLLLPVIIDGSLSS